MDFNKYLIRKDAHSNDGNVDLKRGFYTNADLVNPDSAYPSPHFLGGTLGFHPSLLSGGLDTDVSFHSTANDTSIDHDYQGSSISI